MSITTMRKRIFIIANIGFLAVVLIVMLIVWFGFFREGSGRITPVGETPFSKPGLTINSVKFGAHLSRDEEQILTLAKYEKIQSGMTYDELTAILGLPADRWRPPDMEYVAADAPMELTWTAVGDQNKERSITVHLKGKTVTGKSQNGLK
jgi:hypothetical protein